MGWVAAGAAVGAAGSIASAYIASQGSKKLAKALKEATGFQRDVYKAGVGYLEPYREVGPEALAMLKEKIYAGPGEFQQDPGYLFRMQEGIKSLERGAAARGTQLSGEQLKGLQRYGQDYASGEYQNFLNRYYQSLVPYASLVDLGQSAAAQTSSMGTATGANLAQTYNALGQAQAQQYTPWAQAAGSLGQGIGNALSIYGSQQQPQQTNAMGYGYNQPQYGNYYGQLNY